MRCHDLRHTRDRDMSVHVKGEAFRPDFPSWLAVLARSRIRIFVTTIRHSLSPRLPSSVTRDDPVTIVMLDFNPGLEHPEVLPKVDAVFFDFSGSGNDRDAAGGEDHDVVRNFENELRVLLDQHDRKPAFL